MKTKYTRFFHVFTCWMITGGILVACASPAQMERQPTASSPVSRPTTPAPALAASKAISRSVDLENFGVTPPPPATTIPQTPGALPDLNEINATPDANLIREMVAQVNQEHALTDLRRLTGMETICIQNNCHTITDRETGSEGLQVAKDYVVQVLISLGYTVERLPWSRSGRADENLIVRKTGLSSPGEEIYLVAHLDGFRAEGAATAPAADDNATGVVSLLELARTLIHYPPQRTIVLFFSTGEEHGVLGVSSYLDQLPPEQLQAIQFAVSVEMLGYDSDNDGAMQVWSGDQPQDFAQKLSEIIRTYEPGLTPQIVPGCT